MFPGVLPWRFCICAASDLPVQSSAVSWLPTRSPRATGKQLSGAKVRPGAALCCPLAPPEAPCPSCPAPAGIFRSCHHASGIPVILRSVLLCSSTLMDLFLNLQVHLFNAACNRNLSRTGLENKPSIPLQAQLRAGRALQGMVGEKPGPRSPTCPGHLHEQETFFKQPPQC